MEPAGGNLYPVVDQLLEAWHAAPDREMIETWVVGHMTTTPASYRIVVNKHHGNIKVDSTPGHPSFRVRLPIYPDTP